MNRAYAIAGAIRYRPNPPERDWRYLKFIKQFPCCACGQKPRWIEAAHVGPHGLGQKASDKNALPLCPKCHRTGPNALHRIGPVKFQALHGISFAELIVYFQGMYQG